MSFFRIDFNILAGITFRIIFQEKAYEKVLCQLPYHTRILL